MQHAVGPRELSDLVQQPCNARDVLVFLAAANLACERLRVAGHRSGVPARNTPKRTSPKVTLLARPWLWASCALATSSRTNNPPAKGITVNVARLLSHGPKASRLTADLRAIAASPQAAAGAGPRSP